MLDENGPQSQAGPESDENSGRSREPDQQFPVVAIGASAGGLEALTGLLRHLPADTGMAFVVIQHLDPHHESILAQLLSRETAMPVSQAKNGTTLSPNQVFVIPPNVAMTISGLALTLTPRESGATAVDGFLRSLAASQRNTAVAIILSGTGSDGALGVQAIAEEGGIVFAQEPASARFDGMPRSAIGTGCVDFILPPAEIAVEVARIAREPRLIEREPLEISRHFPASEEDLETLFDLLRASTGIEFDRYRQSTFRRRLVRRLVLLKISSLAEYVKYAKENSDELHALAADVLIRVTHFFRDADAFDALSRRALPALIRKASKDSDVRIWVPGCSTGEEAYSIAICFLEVAERMHSRVPCKIFATDINGAAIEKARRGVYVENIVADVSQERLERFFLRAGRQFQIGKRLRELCIFSRHDLLKDPPFSRLDLISCRNVLIYLDSTQERVLSRFHFALNPGGYLLLGKSERADRLFTPVDSSARLYVRQESARAPVPVGAIPNWPPTSTAGVEAGDFEGAQPPRKIDPWRLADRVLADRYAPPGLIVDSNLEAIYSSGAVVFSTASSNNPANTLLESAKIAQPDALREAIRKAAETGESVRIEQVVLEDGDSAGPLSVEVTPIGPGQQHFLIVFEKPDAPPAEGGTSESPTRETREKFEMRIRRLEKELASSRAHLESVLAEHEATNEEAVAANEELQSLNEELGTSKEEVEAANEELTTVNQELQIRSSEIERAREFAQATIDTVRNSLLVLGPGLLVQRANRAFYRTFRLSAEEVENQFIYELGDRVFGKTRLRELLEEILPANRVMEDFEIEYQSKFGSQRVLVLNARRFEAEERILLAIEDATESRRAETELRQSQKMEAIGYLAAGVAHDFNNLLTGVIGNASLVRDALPEGDLSRVGLENVISGGERAADLTRQLLAYAGKGRLYLERVDLSEAVIETGKLIHPSIPPKVQLRLELDRGLPPLLADPAQIQQVVMNLVINAAESIGDAGGLVLVKTGRQTVTLERLPGLVSGERVAAGEYVFLEVLDNGSGMDKETIEKIFDPFFSTKFTGRGLGLAAVLGIVRQYKGGIQIHSFPGRGSSFRVLFSVVEHAQPTQIEVEVGEDLRGAGAVLAVDDEEIIRNFTKSALETYGYQVLLARDGSECVRMFQKRLADIRVVLLDVAMPGMDALEVLKRIREIRPDVPVVICTGLGDVEAEKRFEGIKISGIFQKPYTVKQLARKVKECIAPAGTAQE